MPWKQTSKGRYERAFDSIEDSHRAIKAVGAPLNREHFSIRASIKFQIDVSSIEETTLALRHAWRTIRYNHPQLAAIDYEGTYVYEVPDDASLELWLSSTFLVEPQGANSSEELYGKLQPTDLAMLYYFPQTSQLMLHTSHWRIDGIGTMHLFNDLFDILANPREVHFGDEAKNLLIGVDEANNVPTQVSAQMDQIATELLMRFVENSPSIGLPTKVADVPLGSERCEIRIDEPLTLALVSRCRVLGITVTVAVHAAVISALRQYSNHENASEKRKYSNLTPVDLRRRSPSPYNGRGNAVSNFHTPIPVIVTPSTFLDHTAQLQKQYTEGIIITGPKSLFNFLDCYVRKACDAFMRPPPPEAIPPSEPALSSLGIIDHFLDKKHGDRIEILDYWIGLEMISRQIECYVWTWKGTMRLSGCYNEAYYDRVFVEKFLYTIKDILIEGLGI